MDVKLRWYFPWAPQLGSLKYHKRKLLHFAKHFRISSIFYTTVLIFDSSEVLSVIFVSCDDSLIGQKETMGTNVLNHFGSRGRGLFPEKKISPINLFLNVQRPSICCGSSMLHVIYPCVYYLQQCGHLNNSCLSCFLLSSVFVIQNGK